VSLGRCIRGLAVAVLGAGAAVAAAAAHAPCAAFKWNVAHEQALFAAAGAHAVAGRDTASAPLIRPGRLYILALAPQQDVHFVKAPEKRGLDDGAYAGLARLRIPAAGLYRVSLDRPFWIDVVSSHGIVESRDFGGRPGCAAPHKIVLYSLPTGVLVLQLSGDVASHVRLTLTRAPRARSSQ
jgi:hypothetical protein